MEKPSEDILYFIMATTFVLLLLVVVVISLLLASKNRRLKHNNAILQINANFQKEIDTTKQEVMEQVLADVSAELHDNVGQTLTLAILNLNQVKDKDPGLIMETGNIIRQAIQEIRDLSHRISRDYWNQFNIGESLKILEEQLKRLKSIKTNFAISDDITNLGKDKEILVFRIIQELINNSLKHSKADTISLIIDYETNNLKLLYTDNGIGLKDPSLNKSNGLGMSSIKTRLTLCKATWEIKSPNDHGFVFEAIIPV